MISLDGKYLGNQKSYTNHFNELVWVIHMYHMRDDHMVIYFEKSGKYVLTYKSLIDFLNNWEVIRLNSSNYSFEIPVNNILRKEIRNNKIKDILND